MKDRPMPPNTTSGHLFRQQGLSNGHHTTATAHTEFPLEDRTQGEIEAQVSDAVRRYLLEYTGRGPRDVHAHLIGDLLLVRMTGVLTTAEQHLAASTVDKGRTLLKQVRRQLVELARKELEAAIRICTFVNVISMHHDVSTVTGEEIIVFTLDRLPATRPTRRK
jgi:uncharacterized protein YbcI